MEDAFRRAGACGRYQVLHVVLTQCPRFVCVWAIFLMLLGGFDPGWRCAPEVTFFNASLAVNTSSRTGTNLTYHRFLLQPSSLNFNVSKNQYYEDTVLDQNITLNLNETKSGSVYSESCRNIDNNTSCDHIEFNPRSSTVVTEFELICDRAWVVRLILAVQGLGCIPGSFAAGQIAEQYGRKVGLSIFVGMISVFTFLGAFSPHWIMYAICGFFIHCGVHGSLNVGSIYTMEVLNSKWRGFFGAIPIWTVSFLLFTVVTRTLKYWVHVHIVTGCLALLAFVGVLLVPESPRWLIVNGKRKRAVKCIRTIAKINRKPDPFEDNQEIVSQLHLNNHDNDKAESATASSSRSYLDIFRNEKTREYFVKITFVLTTFFLMYFGLSFGIQTLPGDFYTNIIMSSCFDIAIGLMVGVLSNRVGRRWAGGILAAISATCCGIIIAVIALGYRNAHPDVIRTSAFVAKSCCLGIFLTCQLFLVELFPTEIRSMAFGLIKVVSGIGNVLVPFIIPSSSDKSFIAVFCVMCVCFLTQAYTFISFPETNKRDLIDSFVHVDQERPLEAERKVKDEGPGEASQSLQTKA